MHPRPWQRTLLGFAVACLAAVFPHRAEAVPRVDSLWPAAGYGEVTVRLNDVQGSQHTYLFTVEDTHATYGIKGLVVYGPRPLGMSSPSRVNTKLYQSNHRYSWWDINGGPDGNGNGLPDRFIEPGEVVPQDDPNLTFTLTYNRAISLSEWAFGLHVVEPFTGKTFFAGADPPENPCALLQGLVYCPLPNDGKKPIASATVELLNSAGSVVLTTQTDADGRFSFTGMADGSYGLRVLAADYATRVLSNLTYRCLGSDVNVEVPLSPLPVNYLVREELCGRVFFSDVQAFRDREAGTAQLQDLFNPAFASPTNSKSYRYIGTIPQYPELGQFGGAGQPQIWVIIQEPLLPENLWHNCSLTNLVGVEDGTGTGAGRPRSAYTFRFLLSQPFTGPGTAHDYAITGLETQPASLTPPTWTRLPSVQLSGPPAPTPPLDEVPAGWMAKTRFQMRQMPGVNNVIVAVGHFFDVCGHQFDFRIHPEVKGP